MEQFDLQVMLPDGTFADYIVKTERDSEQYQVFNGETPVATFSAGDNGEWTVSENSGNIDADLESRIKEQLKGFRT